MLSDLGNIAAYIPYWMADQIPLYLFIFAVLFIVKLRSKTAVILLITLSAVITFYLSYTITTGCWADLKCSLSSQQEVCHVNSYCNVREEDSMALFSAFIKALVVWFIALAIYFLKLKFRRNK